MALVSGKALWSIICGQSVLASDEVVGEELEEAATHLQEGVLFYRSFSEADHKSWCEKTKLKKEKQEFVYKLGNLLELCSEQSWEMFQLFLQHEYRGSATQLQSAASSDREETSLLHQVFSFYLSDPLHLLSCRRHILAADSSHPYEKLFKEFIRKVLDEDCSLGQKLISQLRKMNVKETFTPKSSLLQLPPNAEQARTLYQLSTIKHQLATLLVYYGSPENPCSPESVKSLILLAQGIGLGREFTENASRSERNLLLNQLDTIDAFHSFLITLLINADSDPKDHPLCDPEWISRLSPMIQSLGSKPWHYPPILAWAVLQGRRVANDPAGNVEEANRYSRLVQRAIKGNVFQYMESALKITAFQTDQLLLVIGASVTYSLMCIVGTCIDLEKIELMPQVHQLAKVCLSYEPTSHFFWNEGGAEASVILPSALEVFPHSPSALLDIATSLASASKTSASKVIELMKELENFTWAISDYSNIGVSGSQCVTRTDLFPIPDFMIPRDTHGVILNMGEVQSGNSPLLVAWQMSTDAWQVLLANFKLLYHQIDCGGSANDWCLEMVIKGLKLLSAIIRTEIQHALLFQELQNVAHVLLVSVSQLLKPNYDLISALLEFFAETSKISCSSLWSDLDGCSLLPSLSRTRPGRKSTPADLLTSYRAGTIRSFVCGVEASTGNFTLLVRLCALVQIAVKNGLNLSSIRGTVVFVVKEVVPAMLLWRSADVSSKIEIIESTFSLLHHSLEEGALDGELQELIVNELSNPKGGAGATLKSVLESSANLQSTLDQPAEWPHSSHAKKLTRMAKLALSVAHRLVGQYLKSGDRLSHFFLEGAASGTHTTGGMSHGVWVALRPPHLALTIAHFVYHRLNPRLPYLALRTLTRLAKEMGVPIVACLGSEAEGLRDCLLTRLDSSTEDLWVKVSILRLLTTSTPHQPGLIRLFLTPPPPLLDTIISLLQQHKESKTEAGLELLLALVELVASLWVNNLTTATSYLREKESFWDGISHCLCNKEPEEKNDDVIGGIFRIYSLEYYESRSFSPSEKFLANLNMFLDGKSDKFSSWVKYVFLVYVERKAHPMIDSSEEKSAETKPNSGSSYGLLDHFCQFLIIILTRSLTLLSDEQKKLLGMSVMESLLSLFETESGGDDEDNGSVDTLQIILSEIHLSILSHCGRLFADAESYTTYLGRLLGCLTSSVMQTRVKAQVMILAGTLKVCSSSFNKAEELSSHLVNSAMLLVEQHCSLAVPQSSQEKNLGYSYSSSACLALACTLLHQCLKSLEKDTVKSLLESSHLIYALLQAAVKHTEAGNSMVVREIYRLLCFIARTTEHINDLNTNSLAMSVSLVLASQKKFDPAILRNHLWCTTFCLKKEGSSGLEGAVSLVAVHLSTVTAALATPDTEADLAHAASALTVTLAPYHQLWRVLNQDCFEQLVAATAGCIHRATKMLHLKESLEREVTGKKGQCSKSLEGVTQAALPLSDGTISLINQLLQILSLCLETVRILSPDITDLLCCPGTDLNEYTFDLVQPSIRRQSGEQVALPNLATLADVLDLYHTFVQKDGRHSIVGVTSSAGVRVSLNLLTHCAEEALILFMVYSTLVLMDPNVQAREARDVRTFLADETSSFFNHWIGRRSVTSTSSPLPPLRKKLALSDLYYFMMCRQVITALCNPKKS